MSKRRGAPVGPAEVAALAEPAAAAPWLRENWRWVAYVGFVLVRLAMHARDGNFPVYDGAQYVEKAAWMAQSPLARAFTGEAFAHGEIRPPGPMWLLLPFMIVSNTLASFVVGMSVWIALFIELGITRLVPAGSRLRNWSAVAMLAGVALFFSPRDFFLVDGLIGAQTVAALGCAAAWLRTGRRREALLLGGVLALAVLTKPAGLYLMASIGAGVAVGLAVLWRQERRDWRSAWIDPLKRLALWAGIPAAVGLAGLLFTPYSITLTFPKLMKVPGFGNRGQTETFSTESLRMTGEYVWANLGAAPAVLLLGVGGWFLVRTLRGRTVAREAAVHLLVCVAAGGLLLCTLSSPVIQARYLVPACLAIIGAVVTGAVAARSNAARQAVVVCAIALATWQTLLAKGKMWHRPPVLVAYAPFDPQKDAKALFSGFASHVERSAVAWPVVFTTDFFEGKSALGTSTQFAHAGVEEVAEMLRAPKRFWLRTPEFPAAPVDDAFSTTFLTADYLTASAPGVNPAMPKGSGSADWERINDQLWNATLARHLGWDELVRTKKAVLYTSRAAEVTSAGVEVPWGFRRAAWLKTVSLDSLEAPKLQRRLEAYATLVGVVPAGRNLQHRFTKSDALEVRLEPAGAEPPTRKPGNGAGPAKPSPWAAPHSVGFRLDPAYKLAARLESETTGPAVILRVGHVAVATTGATLLAEARLRHDKDVEIPLRSLMGQIGPEEPPHAGGVVGGGVGGGSGTGARAGAAAGGGPGAAAGAMPVVSLNVSQERPSPAASKRPAVWVRWERME